MKSSNMRFAISLILLAVALVLMCIGIRWVFFLGLSLAGVSSALSSSGPTNGRGAGWLIALILQIAACLFILWLSSFGRDPLTWSTAVVVMFAVGISEFEKRKGIPSSTYRA
jgi:hypothetical protein